MKSFLAAALLAVPAAAQAGTVTVYTDRALFEAAAGPVAVETFDDVPGAYEFPAFWPEHGSATYADRPLVVGDLTLRTTGARSGSASTESWNGVNQGPAADIFGNGIDGTNAARVMTWDEDTVFTITFAHAVTAFGFDTRGLNDPARTPGEARTGISLTDTLIVPSIVGPKYTEGPVRFLGYVSDTAFSSVSFLRLGDSDRFGLDNVTYSAAGAAASPVPVPATLPLLALGLGALGWMRRGRA